MSDDDLANVATVSAGNNEVVRPRSLLILLPYMKGLGGHHRVWDNDLANVATVSAGNNKVVRACKPHVRVLKL